MSTKGEQRPMITKTTRANHATPVTIPKPATTTEWIAAKFTLFGKDCPWHNYALTGYFYPEVGK